MPTSAALAVARALFAVALPILALPAAGRAAPELRPPSRIDAVTVYRTSARVERVARVELPAGGATVVLEGLPEGLDDDSIRVRGEGAARARLFGVTVERVTAERSGAAEVRAAEERLEGLADQDRALEDRIAAAKVRARFVEGLRSTYSEERARNLAVRPISSREWAELIAYVDGELRKALADQRQAEQARRELARTQAQARSEVEKLQAKRGLVRKAVAVEIEAERSGPGAFELRVSYAVASAGWRPVWDVRLAPERSSMELSFQGSVWQRSGEDWSQVTLALSTAAPARGLEVPRLEPRWLTRSEPRPPFRHAGSRSGGAVMAREAPPPPQALEDADAPVEMEIVQASVEEGLLAATFTAPRRERVDGSGQARKIALARFPLEATVVRTSAPRLEPAAFLTAKAVNATGFPLLAGEAGVYVGEDFAGRAALPFTPAGGELELAFGRDDRIEVDRKLLDRRHETAGIVSKQEIWRYRVRVGVKNRYPTPVSVRLLDLVPVSRDEKIEVEILEGTTAATREDPERPGVRIHELTLAPGEEQVIELRYRVRYPRGFPVAGLE